jgi:hypothetical protein
MKNNFLLWLCLAVTITSCGQINDVKKIADIASSGSQSNQAPAPLTNYGPYTPGAYFKILKDVGSTNDIRLYEFSYKYDGTFESTQKSFAGGNMAEGYFHKTTGTFKEDSSGMITHTIQTDTCNDLTMSTASVSGDARDVVRVISKGTTIELYSALSWTIPKSFTDSIGTMTEDIGCKKFN